MFFNLSPTSKVDSFSETLASALPRMKLSRSLFSTHLLHSSSTFTPNSLLPLIAAVDNAVHSGVRCIWQLQERHMYVFSLLGMDLLPVLQFLPMVSVVKIFFFWSVPRNFITRTSQKKIFFWQLWLKEEDPLKILDYSDRFQALTLSSLLLRWALLLLDDRFQVATVFSNISHRLDFEKRS